MLADRPTPMGGPVKKTSTAAAKSGRRGEKVPAVVKSAQQGSAAAHKQQPTSNTATSARKQQPKKTRWTSMQRLLAEANTVFSSKPSPMGGIHPRDDSSKHAVGPSSAARAPAAGNATDPKKSATRRPSAAVIKVGRVCELQLPSSRVKGGGVIRGQEYDCCQPAGGRQHRHCPLLSGLMRILTTTAAGRL